VSLKWRIDASQTSTYPPTSKAEIKATTAFGNKFVDLIYPDQPTRNGCLAGQVLHSRNVAPR